MKIVILAGGSGSRLWPVSRKNNPKQVQPFLDDDTMLQKTYKRLRRGFNVDDIFIATAESYIAITKKQLPELPQKNIISEPYKRDTAAAIGLAAIFFYFRNPNEIIITVHADHYIDDEEEYIKTLKLAGKLAEINPGRGVLIGVRPAYPETGFGYIKINGQFFSLNDRKIFTVEEFIEKPNSEKAKNYISKWEYLWNPGYFIWRVDTLLAQYKKHLPEMYKSLVEINRALETKNEKKVIDSEFKKITPKAFDYGILEKADNLLVVPTDFVFTDIGNWRTAKRVLSGNKKNAIKGKVIELDSSNNLIYNFTNRPLTCAGLKDMIIVAVEDATLVCHQDSAQDVKKIVEKLKEAGLEKYL
ncbi:MAG: mannose-1-phosphate guanylyltransferase [Patescibacteria group bacterium]|jgi:mannose-1-phosphate guanylyltransferase